MHDELSQLATILCTCDIYQTEAEVSLMTNHEYIFFNNQRSRLLLTTVHCKMRVRCGQRNNCVGSQPFVARIEGPSKDQRYL